MQTRTATQRFASHVRLARVAPRPSCSTKCNALATRATPAPPLPLASPAAGFEKSVEAGVAKAELSPLQTFVRGMLAGGYIGLGCVLMFSVGGNCPGLASSNLGLQKMVSGLIGLPFGLLMVVLTGAELYTGNTAFVTAAVLEGKASFGQLVKNWSMSYLGNLAGSLLLAWAACQTGMFATAAAPAAAAVAKTSMPWMQAFMRGALANWCVCLAVHCAASSSTLPGKALAVLFPVSAFVAMGWEHSVANMALIPIGMMSGASSVGISEFVFGNLIPVTLGNTFAGVVLVACAFSFAFGKLGGKTA